jgi:hypothetical protein
METVAECDRKIQFLEKLILISKKTLTLMQNGTNIFFSVSENEITTLKKLMKIRVKKLTSLKEKRKLIANIPKEIQKLATGA